MTEDAITALVRVATASQPGFAGDGRRVAFIGAQDGPPHVLVLDPGAGHCRDLTPEAGVVYRIAMRPGRDELAYVTDVGGDEQYQIHLTDLRGIEHRPLAAAGRVIHDLGGWSPDGNSIAFASNARDDRFFDIHVLDLARGERRCLLEHDGMNAVERFSVDGRALVFSRPNLDRPGDNDLFVVGLDETGAAAAPPRCVTRHEGAHQWRSLHLYANGTMITLSDEGRSFVGVQRIDGTGGARRYLLEYDWDVETGAVSRDGRRLAVVVNEGGYSRLEAFALTGAGELGEPLPLPPVARGVITDPCWRPDGSAVAFAHEGARIAPSIILAETGRERSVSLPGSSRRVANIALTEPEVVGYPSFDGWSIPAFFYRPANGSPPWPCLVLVHGGPESQSRPALWRRYPAPLWLLLRGVALLVPNVRGSTGYGKEYAHADDREKRMDAVADLLAGADWIAGHEDLDAERIAVMGPSYGGFMVLAAITEAPERWAAAIDLYGVANFETLLRHTGRWRQRHRAREYGDHPALLRRISPIHKAHRIRTPLLVVQGERDVRVPPEESEQIVAAVRANGGQVEYVVYPNEGHGIEQPAHRLDLARRIVAFCATHLGLELSSTECL